MTVALAASECGRQQLMDRKIDGMFNEHAKIMPRNLCEYDRQLTNI